MCRFFFCISITLLAVFQIHAQRRRGDANYLGVQAKGAVFTINTSDLPVDTGKGFIAGFTTRGRFYNDFDLVYGLDFLLANLEVLSQEDTKLSYKIQGVHLNVLGSYRIIDQYLSVEAGPILSLTSKLKLDDNNTANQIIKGYTALTAQDIEDISPFNLNGYIGITGGLRHIRLTLGYQYAFFNTLKKLNSQELKNKEPAATHFKGNTAIITAGLLVYL